MRRSDLAAAEALGTAFHVHHPERPEIAPERFALAPDLCFVLESEDGSFAGYCIAHPWGGALPPGLDTLLGRLPDTVDTLHVHDVVLMEAARGKGHAGSVLRDLLAKASGLGLRQATLISVGGAERYWSRCGFSVDTDMARVAFVDRSYGAGARPMLKGV